MGISEKKSGVIARFWVWVMGWLVGGVIAELGAVD